MSKYRRKKNLKMELGN